MKIRRDPLDILAAKYIKLRDKWCQRCGGTGGLQTAHFHSRRLHATRYDPDNLCLLCFGCHQYLDSNASAKIEFFKSRLSEERFEELELRAKGRGKIDRAAWRLYLNQLLKVAEDYEE